MYVCMYSEVLSNGISFFHEMALPFLIDGSAWDAP